jgi:hypothetical protein
MGPEQVPMAADRLIARAKALIAVCDDFPGQQLLMKTHSAYVQFHGAPQIPPEATLAAILVVRNPFDVMCSCMNHFGFDAEGAFDFLAQPTTTMGESSTHFPVLCTSWDEFSDSWMSARDFPVLVQRYEDMKSHPFTCVRSMARAFKIQVTEDDIIDTIVANRFKNLQALEGEQGFGEASMRGERFFFRGEVGYFKEILSEQMILKVWERFGPMMKKLGYGLENGDLVVGPIPQPGKN